jgi:4-alpha-glucanotransferase
MYHLYCQWQLDEQLSRMSGCDAASATGAAAAPLAGGAAGLFLDLPLGVHPGGFDTWRWPELFAAGMSAGAPPDAFFAHGQDWEFPPLHPRRASEQGHQYFAACLRAHMRHAAYLRIDHVMSLHRLFWVPTGAEPADGVYVTYPAEELYAVLSLESHRNKTVVVGEDLGTVPAEVRPAMRRHGVLRTWVFQGGLRPRAADPVGSVPAGSVVSLNTHDMFPYAGFVSGDDISARVRTGQLDEAGARREIAARRRLVTRLDAWLPQILPPPETSRAAAMSDLIPEGASSEAGRSLGRALGHLARSDARLALVSLDDILLETQPQNMPGTGAGWGNWQRKLLDVRPRKS